MPRLPLSEQRRPTSPRSSPEGASAPEPAPWLATADAARGRELLDVKGCGLCHRITGAAPLPGAMLPAGVTVSDMARAVRLAPDLRFTRDRWTPSSLVAWLVDPQRVKADTLMPTMGLTEGEARSIAAYLLTAPLGPLPVAVVPERLPALARKVTYDEVATRVFRKTCWHCHGEPDFERGDGGPGNSGGFGFKGVGLNLSNYASTFAGFLDARGDARACSRRSRAPDRRRTRRRTSIAALLARQAEEAGQEPALRGMPLGLPALGAEDVQLVGRGSRKVAPGRRPRTNWPRGATVVGFAVISRETPMNITSNIFFAGLLVLAASACSGSSGGGAGSGPGDAAAARAASAACRRAPTRPARRASSATRAR